MNERRKKIARIVALVLAVLLAASTLISALTLLVSAAEEEDTDAYVNADTAAYTGSSKSVIDASVTSVDYSSAGGIQKDSLVKIVFAFTVAGDDQSFSTASPSDFTIRENWWVKKQTAQDNTTPPSEAKMSIDTSNHPRIQITIENLTYTDMGVHRRLTVTSIKNGDSEILAGDAAITMRIPAHQFYNYDPTVPNDVDDYPNTDGNTGGNVGGSTGGDEETEETYTSNIVFESATIRNTEGKKLEEVTEESEPFEVEVTYTDTSLRGSGANIQAFFVPGGSFATTGTTKGAVKQVRTTGNVYPRFKATFSDITYTGTGNEFTFQVYYLGDRTKDPVKGDGKAFLSEAKPNEEEESKDEDKMGMAVPKIIIDSYSYGDETIVAGDEFNLDFSIRNTSAQLPLENIVITMTPSSAAEGGPGLLVASSSNTIYVPALGTGAAMPYQVAFKAQPDAKVTSHLIEIKFSYEYIDTDKKTREKAEMTESIAIPVFQTDRFTVDPIAESAYAQVDEEVYLLVSFANLGKSTTYNLSAAAKTDNPAITSTTQRYGHLEPGKNDTLEIPVTSSEPGEFTGEVVVTYEDENGDTNEVTTPFSLTVEAPYVPPEDDGTMMPPDIGMEGMEPAGPRPLSIALCVVGGLSIAGPISLYLMKRVKAKASEGFDEDF